MVVVVSGFRRIKEFFPESNTSGLNQLFAPATINCVSRVSCPISVFLASDSPLSKITKQTIRQRSSGLFYAIGEKASLLQKKNSAAHIKQGVRNSVNAIKHGTKKINFAQAMKRFRFKGKAKIISAILAVGLVTYSAFASD